nr:hypothetical protein [uncultured Lichenicoccus sp.]
MTAFDNEYSDAPSTKEFFSSLGRRRHIAAKLQRLPCRVHGPADVQRFAIIELGRSDAFVPGGYSARSGPAEVPLLLQGRRWIGWDEFALGAPVLGGDIREMPEMKTAESARTRSSARTPV